MPSLTSTHNCPPAVSCWGALVTGCQCSGCNISHVRYSLYSLLANSIYKVPEIKGKIILTPGLMLLVMGCSMQRSIKLSNLQISLSVYWLIKTNSMRFQRTYCLSLLLGFQIYIRKISSVHSDITKMSLRIIMQYFLLLWSNFSLVITTNKFYVSVGMNIARIIIQK